MIVFDLRCGTGHVFEAWFGSSGDYDDQVARGLVDCPVCGSSEVGKAVMAPRVGSGERRGDVSPVEAKAMLRALAAAQGEALKNSRWVGRRFAEEARAIHAGERTGETIHGQATPAEAKALIDDGVPVAPLPLPVAPPESTH
ncbi:DUF1178 family protein [Sphingomonas sp.]|uniref:DUF1178 family protein n=1 Tax=Sphingomonas sp. TaxID=28214 RepID=UPI0035C7E6A1